MRARDLKQLKNYWRRDIVEAKALQMFGEHAPIAIQILDELGAWERERTQLALIKLSHGDLQQLRDYAAIAKLDPRDVLTPAESPSMSQAWSTSYADWEKLPKPERDRIEEQDYQEYVTWLLEA